MSITPESVLFVTLDSCRYDAFQAAFAPHMKAIAPLHRAMAPSYFTFASHAAMFVGFTPGLANVHQPLLNPKYGKIFKLAGPAFPEKGSEGFALEGRNIIDGFKRLGYLAIGTGATLWFNPQTATAPWLISDFEEFYYPGNTWSLAKQVAWIEPRLAMAGARNVFVFLNVGETHPPYYHEGASWTPQDNPCVPFQALDRSADCRIRQQACIEFADRCLSSLLDRFRDASIVLCSDHGDCWGEDGLWEHGISHEMTLAVPLIIRLRGQAIENHHD